MHGYTNSDYTGDLDKCRSTMRYVFTLSQAPVNWSSTLQFTVALSTTEAEYMALAEAIKEMIWLQGPLDDLRINMIFSKSIVIASTLSIWQRTKSIMSGLSTLMSGFTLYARISMRMISN